MPVPEGQTGRRTDRRTNIMAIARLFVLTNTSRAKMIGDKSYMSYKQIRLASGNCVYGSSHGFLDYSFHKPPILETVYQMYNSIPNKGAVWVAVGPGYEWWLPAVWPQWELLCYWATGKFCVKHECLRARSIFVSHYSLPTLYSNKCAIYDEFSLPQRELIKFSCHMHSVNVAITAYCCWVSWHSCLLVCIDSLSELAMVNSFHPGMDSVVKYLNTQSIWIPDNRKSIW